MLSTLITSKSRVKIITLFITHPGVRYHYRHIIKMLNLSAPSVRNELKRLQEAGMLISDREANIRFYQINQNHPLYPELKSIIYKTSGLADALKENLGNVGNLEFAFVYGSVAKNTEDVNSDIDLMFIGNPDYDKLAGIVSEDENKLSREINFTVISREEWKKKVREKGFAYNVNKDKKIFLIGNEDELRKIS